MEIYSTPPLWLEILGWLALVCAFISAVYILIDIYLVGHRQKMWIMEIVYPVTALYFGPFALWFYLKYGRKKSKGKRDDSHQNKRKIKWSQTSEGVFHCGAGCTLGDIMAGWLIFATGFTIASKALYADFLLDFIFAWLLGVAFQYYTIVPMRNLGKLQGVWESIKADTLSIIAFQIGLFFGMYVYQELVFSHPLSKTTASYWFLMQLSMIIGFFTAYPINKFLLKKGIKAAM